MSRHLLLLPGSNPRLEITAWAIAPVGLGCVAVERGPDETGRVTVTPAS